MSNRWLQGSFVVDVCCQTGDAEYRRNRMSTRCSVVSVVGNRFRKMIVFVFFLYGQNQFSVFVVAWESLASNFSKSAGGTRSYRSAVIRALKLIFSRLGRFPSHSHL